MLHDNHRIAQFDQPIELSHQSLNIGRMQSGCRFVENIQRVSALVALQFRRELDALRFAARQFSRGLPQPQVSQADLLQNREGVAHLRLFRKELARAIHRHRQNFRDVFAPILYLQGLRVVARSVACRAGRVYARHEQQFYANKAFSFAGFTPALSDVEGEPAGGVMPGASGLRLGKDPADVVEQTGVRGKVRSRCTSNGFLVDLNQPFDGTQALDDSAFGRRGRISAERICIFFIGPERECPRCSPTSSTRA